jgi:hypothetical protein
VPKTTPLLIPQDFGFKDGDHHLVIDSPMEIAKIFNFKGDEVQEFRCLPFKQGAVWEHRDDDIAPGLYELSLEWNGHDYLGDDPEPNDYGLSRGWFEFKMTRLKKDDDINLAKTYSLCGGGSQNGWPDAWLPRQVLYSSKDCVRMHNVDLRDSILPAVRKGRVFASIYQRYK